MLVGVVAVKVGCTPLRYAAPSTTTEVVVDPYSEAVTVTAELPFVVRPVTVKFAPLSLTIALFVVLQV